MPDVLVLDGEFSLILPNYVSSSLDLKMDGDVGVSVETGRLPIYDGPTEVTPSTEQQVLETNQHAMRSNIVIAPIPSNYGLVTWDGSTITVS